MTIKLRNLGDEITKKYKNLSIKFQNMIPDSIKNSEELSSANSDISTNDKTSEITNLKNDLLVSQNPLVNKEKLNN